MAKLTRSSVLFPLCCVFVSFVLSSLLVFSGWRKGFVEELALVRFNIKAIADRKPLAIVPNGTERVDELPSWVRVNISQSNAQKESHEQTRIPEWFSLHLLTSCSGQYSNGTSDSGGYHRVSCSEPNPAHSLNLSAALDGIRPRNSSLARQQHGNWKTNIDEKLNIFNSVLLPEFVLYAAGMGSAGLAAVWSVASAFAPTNKSLVDINLIMVSSSAVSLLAGTIMVMVASTQGVKDINMASTELGMIARKGNRFIVFSWASTVLMLFAFGYWTSKFVVLKRRQKWQQEKGSI